VPSGTIHEATVAAQFDVPQSANLHTVCAAERHELNILASDNVQLVALHSSQNSVALPFLSHRLVTWHSYLGHVHKM
jgi:hypothetical protein